MPAQTRAMAKATSKANQQRKPLGSYDTTPPATSNSGARASPRLEVNSQVSPQPKIKTDPLEGYDLLPPRPTRSLSNLAPEIRLSILKWCLPRNENLILDPYAIRYNHNTPAAFRDPSYEATSALLRVSKQIHHEVVSIIYSTNTPTLLQPLVVPVLERNMPKVGLQLVKDVEVCMKKSLIELGAVFSSWRLHMPAATQLKLNFYHSDEALSCLGELAWRAFVDKHFILKVELHRSAWADAPRWMLAPKPITRHTINNAINMGSFAAQVYDFRMPEQLKTVIVSVSAGRDAAESFRTYKNWAANQEEDGIAVKWRFNNDGNKDTAKCKYLVWGEPGEEPAE